MRREPAERPFQSSNRDTMASLRLSARRTLITRKSSTQVATTTPNRMPIPPVLGTGLTCSERSLGLSRNQRRGIGNVRVRQARAATRNARIGAKSSIFIQSKSDFQQFDAVRTHYPLVCSAVIDRRGLLASPDQGERARIEAEVPSASTLSKHMSCCIRV